MSWNNKYKVEDLKLIPSKPILSDFGKAIDVEDRVELYVYSQDGQTTLFSDSDIGTYTVAEGGILDDGTITQDSVVFLDIHNDIREFVNSGVFRVKYNFFRTLVGSPDAFINDLFIDEISSSRKEIRLKISGDASLVEKEIFEDFGDKLSIKGDVPHWVDVHVNFGNGITPLVVNWQLDKVNTPEFPYSIVLKLYDPLPKEIEEKASCWVVQEMITSVEETVFVESPEIEKHINVLATANFNAGADDSVGGGTTNYETWGSLTNAKESVLNKILNRYFSGSMDSIRPSIDYRRFSHFVRFGSAEERLKNFRYKLSQIEYYDTQIESLQNNTYSSSYHFVANIEDWKVKRNDIISKFDGYDTFLYNESASYVSGSLGEFWPTTWPKQSDINYPKAPYICKPISSSEAIDWYDGAIYSASLYDRHNIHSLSNTAVPLHVHQDPTLGGEETINGEYIKFVNMMGQFYDEIYLYVSAIPEMWDRHNVLDARLVEGQFSGSDMLSKDLLYVGLQSLGYSQCASPEDTDLWSYILGTDASGSYGDKIINEVTDDWGYWNQPDDQFALENYVDGLSPFFQNKIYASHWYQTSHSVAKEDVRLEYSKRILNNLPHLMKTKGTLEGLKAYMNIYGVPQTLFKVKEATGPQPLDYFANHYYLYDYYSYALSFNGDSALTASWDKVTDATIKADNGDKNQYPDTIEFRYKIPDALKYNLKCGKMNLDELENNANKQDMVIVQINSSSFIAVEHASKLNVGDPKVAAASYSFSITDDSKYGRMVFALGINDGTFQYPKEYVSCSTDWAPIFDGDWWNCMVKRNQPVTSTVINQLSETYKYELVVKKSSDWSRGTITHAYSSSMTHNGATTQGRHANISWNSDGFDDDQYVSASFYTPESTDTDYSLGYSEGHFGTNFDSFFIGGAVNSHEWGINKHPSMSWFNYSGSMQELRFWMKPLSQSAFDNHVLNPMAIDGNTYTSSYTDLIARWSLGADLKTYAIKTGTKLSSSHPNQDILRPFSGDRSVYLTSSGFTDVDDYEYQYEKVATVVPNYIGMQCGDKIRIEDNTLDKGNLSVQKRASTSARDKHPKDENRVSVQLTPVDAVNIDIEHQLGGIDFNDLVGDPRARYMEFYPDVVYYDNHYWLKHFGPFQYAEFFKLVKYYDGQILCQLRKTVPGRSKPDFNISIEPHILERPRFAWRQPNIEMNDIHGSMSARVHLHGNTTELGRFKHNGPGDAFYSDWDNRGPLESRYGDKIYSNHRFGHRDQSHNIPPSYVNDIFYGLGGQNERVKHTASLYQTTTGEIEAIVKDPYDPIIRDNVFNCWERDQHAPWAARYEWMIPMFWSGSAGSYYNYTVSTLQEVAATAGKTEVHISGSWPDAAEGYLNATEIVITTTDGTINTIEIGDGRSATAASAVITLPTEIKAEWEDEAVAALHSASIFISDTTGSYFEFHGTGSTTQSNGQPVSSSAITFQDYADNLADTINAHVSFSAASGSVGENYIVTVTQARSADMPSFEFLADGTYIGYDSAILSGSLLNINVNAVTSNNMQQDSASATDFSGGNTLIVAPGGADFTYTANTSTLADRVRTAVNNVSGITCGTKQGRGGTHYVIPVTQSTAGANGNTSIGGNFFGPWDRYYKDYGYTNNTNRIPTPAQNGPFPLPFSGGDNVRYEVTASLVEDTNTTVVTQSNPYWERDAVHILSHPMDPREEERWYDFNKQEYVSSNLLPNKEMSYVNRQFNFPIVNAGLTSYADQQSCRDRGKEWFFPFIGNHRISFYKYTETHRYATDLSASLGIKIPRTQFGQASIGYGNLSGESIVSHSGAEIQNLAGISPMSRSSQYQDYRSKGMMNLIYDGCMMSASDFNVDSPQTVDGGPVVEIIDTTPFVLTSTPPTLGEGPGAVSGEGTGRGIGRYTGRDISKTFAAGKDQVIRGSGRTRGRDVGRGMNIRQYVYRNNPGQAAPTNPNVGL